MLYILGLVQYYIECGKRFDKILIGSIYTSQKTRILMGCVDFYALCTCNELSLFKVVIADVFFSQNSFHRAGF